MIYTYLKCQDNPTLELSIYTFFKNEGQDGKIGLFQEMGTSGRGQERANNRKYSEYIFYSYMHIEE
jgi:hypothetical protein